MGASRKLERAACAVGALFLASASAWAQYAPPPQMQLPQLPQPLFNNTMVVPQLQATPVVPSAPMAAPAPNQAATLPQSAARPPDAAK
jgi:hypothetical protein